MEQVIAALRWLWSRRTTSIGYVQVTLGVLATATDVLPAVAIKWIVLASGLMTALIGHHNVMKAKRESAAVEAVQAPPVLSWLSFFLLFTLFSLATPWAHAAVVGVTEGKFQLVVSNTVQPGEYDTLELCEAAKVKKGAELGVTRVTKSELWLKCQKADRYLFGPAPKPPQTSEVWTQCAAQFAQCAFEGYKRVCYAPGVAACSDADAANDVKLETYGPIACTNEALGRNPASQTPKFCYTSSATVNPPAPITGSAKLKWSLPAAGQECETPVGYIACEITGFEVYHRIGETGAWTNVATLNPALREHTLTNLPAGAHYWYLLESAGSVGTVNSAIVSKTIK
jgi:hypothetical protein